MSLDPVTQGIGLARDITSVVSEFVQDKDLALKIQQAVFEKTMDFTIAIQTAEHVPAYIKFMYALRDVILPTLRPIGAVMLSATAAYMGVKQIPISPAMEAMMGAAFPGWMLSRHFNKQEEQKTEQARSASKVNAVINWPQGG